MNKKLLFRALISSSFLVTLLANANEPTSFFDVAGVNSQVNQTEVIPSDPFDYRPELEGQNFNLISLKGAVDVTMACDGLDFAASASKFRGQLERTADYAMSNWQMLSANYLVFTQPAIASMVENLKDALSFDLDSTLMNCQGARQAAQDANAENWGAHLAHQSCMNRTGGDQLKCLEEAGKSSKIDSYNTGLLTAKARFNAWLQENGKSSSTQDMNLNNDTCVISSISPTMCNEGKKLLPQLAYVSGNTNLQTTKPEMKISEYILNLRSALIDEFVKTVSARSTAQRNQARGKILSISFGTANLSDGQIQKIIDLNAENKGLIAEEAIYKLTTMWAFSTTKKVLNTLKNGYNEAITISPEAIPKSKEKIIELIDQKLDQLNSYEDQNSLRSSEDAIWKAIDGSTT